MPELTAARRRLVLAICCMSLLIVSMDVTIVNVALPAIGRDLGASLSGLQWTVDAYTLVLASLLIFSGSTADRLGRRRVFQVGLATFTAASLLCSLAPGLPALVAFRMVQAVGGSMLNPVAMSIITNVFVEPRERARAIGVWGGVVGISLGLGPVVGGLLVESVGWRGIFWINVPIGLAAMALTARFVPESKAAVARRPDAVGQLLAMVALASLTYAIIEAPRLGWLAMSTLLLGGVALVAGAAFVHYERRREEPLLEPRFFRSVPFSGATVTAVCAFGGFGGFLFLNTLYLQDVRGYTALHAGLLTLPLAVTTLIAAPWSRPDRRHARHPAAAGAGWRRHGRGGADARDAEHAHVAVVAARQLHRLRGRVRDGERPDHEQRGSGDAAQPGRRRRGGRLDQPPGRRHPRHRGRGLGAQLRAGWFAAGRLRVSEPAGVVGDRRLRGCRAGAGRADLQPLGVGQRARGGSGWGRWAPGNRRAGRPSCRRNSIRCPTRGRCRYPNRCRYPSPGHPPSPTRDRCLSPSRLLNPLSDGFTR